MTPDNIITALAITGSALTVYLNWKKVGEGAQNNKVWQALTDKTLKDISTDIKELKTDVTRNDGRLQSQSEAIQKLDVRVTDHDRQFERAWQRIDEMKR